jgi:D-amino-acid oxidase
MAQPTDFSSYTPWSYPLLSDDISVAPEPMRSATANSPRILIVGGGVTGLITAWLLLDQGYRVTIISREWASYGSKQRLTSQIAGALWELPPAACGRQTVQDHLQLCQRWALESLAIYAQMLEYPELKRAFGIQMRMCTIYHTNRIPDDEVKTAKMELITQGRLPEFHWGLKDLIEKYGVNSHGLQDAYEHLAPIIDTDVAMTFLMRLVLSKGGEMYTDTVLGDLLEQEPYLRRIYHADAIINATGLAHETATDPSVYPMRGAVLRVINDGSDFPQIKNAILVSAASRKANGENPPDMAFIVPRNDNILILGAIAQPHQWHFDLTPESPKIQEMRKQCEDLIPALKKARLDPEYPLAQGARPYRVGNVRVEREGRPAMGGGPSRIFHCYGHGGAGWSLAFGSSRACIRLVQEALREADQEMPLQSRL